MVPLEYHTFLFTIPSNIGRSKLSEKSNFFSMYLDYFSATVGELNSLNVIFVGFSKIVSVSRILHQGSSAIMYIPVVLFSLLDLFAVVVVILQCTISSFLNG